MPKEDAYYFSPEVIVEMINLPQPLGGRELVWQPSNEVIRTSNLTHYMHWLATYHTLHFSTYEELWQWSVNNIEAFWESLWHYFNLKYSHGWETSLVARIMPGAKWFVGAKLNYAENIFAKMTNDHPMLVYKAEGKPLVEVSWQDVYDQTKRLARVLRELGVARGDRVVAYLPNIPETIVALLAVASIGAIWSSCSPDFGSHSVLDRFTQIQPKVLIAVDGYDYGGKTFDRRPILLELQKSLPTLEKTILIPHIAASTDDLMNTSLWHTLLGEISPGKLVFEQVSFDHPLWIVYSSGTTGLPKPIVQGHGGILLEHVKATVFHNNLKPSDRFFWHTSTGWMMWNYLVGSLLAGATIILYSGNPSYPDMNTLFELAEQSKMTYFGTSAAFIKACSKAGNRPNQYYDLSLIKALGSTGSPLTPDGYHWVYNNINQHLALESISGGTDLCTAFVGGVRNQPIYNGEIQGASLGAKVKAFNEKGEPLVGEVGELVITEPMPSMPIFFWNDPEQKRYLSSYFDTFPGVWRHGDWIKFNEQGGCVIFGRSDSTINRQGIRIGTSEIYQIVELFPEVVDSLIIDLEFLGRESYLPLFVMLQTGMNLDDDLIQRINQKLREDVSPRHVPDAVFQVGQIPYTLSGKKMEVPIRKILLGIETDKSANRGAMRNPESLDFFIEFARTLTD